MTRYRFDFRRFFTGGTRTSIRASMSNFVNPLGLFFLASMLASSVKAHKSTASNFAELPPREATAWHADGGEQIFGRVHFSFLHDFQLQHAQNVLKLMASHARAAGQVVLHMPLAHQFPGQAAYGVCGKPEFMGAGDDGFLNVVGRHLDVSSLHGRDVLIRFGLGFFTGDGLLPIHHHPRAVSVFRCPRLAKVGYFLVLFSLPNQSPAHAVEFSQNNVKERPISSLVVEFDGRIDDCFFFGGHKSLSFLGVGGATDGSPRSSFGPTIPDICDVRKILRKFAVAKPDFSVFRNEKTYLEFASPLGSPIDRPHRTPVNAAQFPKTSEPKNTAGSGRA